MLLATALSNEELDAVLKRVAPTGVEYGAARICRHLARNPGSRTRDVNRICSVGNISDQVLKSINPRIEDMGLYITCIKPPAPFKNRHGQKTGEMLWSFYRDVPDAANDPDYDAAGLKAELDEIESEHPDTRWDEAIQEASN